MQDSVIIVAGGSGSRFGSMVPKQFLSLGDVPVVMHTLRLFHEYNAALEIILVLPREQFEYWADLCKKHSFNLPHKIVAGGKERFYSVKNGLLTMRDGGIVAIHDAVRPLVSYDTLHDCFTTARLYDNAVPVIACVDSLRKLEDDSSVIVPRQNYKLVQTPQCFEKTKIFEAFQQAYDPEFTDDASVMEKAGHQINLVEGNRENFKITTPLDLQMANFLLKNSNS